MSDEQRGKRLKEERERLGISQADFANACGVGRTAQFNYEIGKRNPSGKYLHAAGELGVDTGYVLFGERSTPNSLYSLGVASVLPAVIERVGLNYAALDDILRLAAESEANIWGKTSNSPTLKGEDQAALIDALFENGALLADVIYEIAKTLHPDKTLALDKKVKVILMLYRLFKPTGKVDTKIVEETIALVG